MVRDVVRPRPRRASDRRPWVRFRPSSREPALGRRHMSKMERPTKNDATNRASPRTARDSERAFAIGVGSRGHDRDSPQGVPGDPELAGAGFFALPPQTCLRPSSTGGKRPPSAPPDQRSSARFARSSPDRSSAPWGCPQQGVVTHASTDRWRVDLTLRSAGWEARRTLGGPTCEAVSQAAALVIALAVNLEARAPLAAKPVSPPTEARPMVPTRRPVDRSRAWAWRSILALCREARWDSKVHSVGKFHTRVSSSERAISCPVAARFPDAATSARRSNLRPRTSALATSSPPRRSHSAPASTAGLTWTSATGFGPIATDKVSNIGFTAGGDLAARWLISRHLAPYVRLGGLIPLARPEFAVQGLGTVYRATPVVLRGGVGIEVHFD